MARKDANIKIFLNGVDPDDAMEILTKSSKHVHGDGCNYSNHLMDGMLDDLDGVYRSHVLLMIKDILTLIGQDANRPTNTATD